MINKVEMKINLVYDYIKKYVDKNSFPPSIREICNALKFSSTNAVYTYINKLEKLGKIKKSASKNRALEIVENTRQNKATSIIVPVVEKYVLKKEDYVEEISSYIAIPQNLFISKKHTFVTKILTDDLKAFGILINDYVVYKKVEKFFSNDIVVYRTESGFNFYLINLENDEIKYLDFSHKQIELDKNLILGKITGVIRKY